MNISSDGLPGSRLFDLPDSEGVNDSERILTALCRKSFLRLWSQTNVFTDEGFKDGKGATKELCDALVVFGNEVIVFSDKHVIFQTDRDQGVAWPRWYKRAIVESCRQLHGAKSWLQRFPDRAFLDAKCTRPLPVPIPRSSAVRFHLVAVTRGSRKPALAHHGGEGLGSFSLNSAIEGNTHHQEPFVVGQPISGKHFVHVFDEVSIELLLNELDTAPDFIDYLKKREALLGQRGLQVTASGEEELLAAYLRTMNPQGTEHVFLNIPDDESLPDVVHFVGDHFATLQDDLGYQRKKHADAISYKWDQLIERFVEHGDPAIHERYINQSAADTERGLRLMASETRYRRRQLAQAFMGALERAQPSQRLSRLVYSGLEGETVYVFLIVPKRQDETYEQYRQDRMALIHACVQTAKLKASLGTIFVGIAFDNPHKDEPGGSEDLFVLTKEEWTAEELVELEQKRREFGLWSDAMEFSRFRQDEFPQANQRVAIERIPAPTNAPMHVGQQQDRRKQLRKIKKDSKRRNRGRK
jgi:hypothetical protein